MFPTLLLVVPLVHAPPAEPPPTAPSTASDEADSSFSAPQPESSPTDLGDSAPPSTLRWSAPQECPDRDQIVARVERILGEPLDEPRSTHVDARLEVVRIESELALTSVLTTESGSRTRTLRAHDCDELADIAALLVAVAIDPGARPPPAEPEVPPPVEDAAEEPPPTEPDPPPEEPSRPPKPAPSEPTPPPQPSLLRLSARFGSGLTLGVLPGPAALVHAKAALAIRAFRIEVGVTHRFAKRTGALDQDGAQAEIWSTVGELSLCGAPSIPRVEFPLCAGIETGTLAGRSHRVRQPAIGRGVWAAFRVGGGLVVTPWRWVGFFVDADALVPVARTGFAIDGLGEVFRASAVGGEITLGLEFPVFGNR